MSDMEQTLIPAQRRRLIREYLEIHQIARSSTLGEMLRASEATIRRDLEWLEMQGIVERTHGGAILSQRLPREPAYAHSAQAHPQEKRAIGRSAAALVEDGDTVFLNSGTTATEVLRALCARAELANITVMTSNVTATLEAWEAPFEIILLGGSFRPRSTSVVGRFALGMLEQVYANKTFVGVDGFSLKYHLTTPSSAEAEIAAAMIERTRGLVAVVADHSKWGVVSNFEMAKIDQIQALIVDEGLSPDARAQLEARSLQVVFARADGAQEPLPKSKLDPERSHAPVLEGR